MLSFSRVGSSGLPSTPHLQLRFFTRSTNSLFHGQRSGNHLCRRLLPGNLHFQKSRPFSNALTSQIKPRLSQTSRMLPTFPSVSLKDASQPYYQLYRRFYGARPRDPTSNSSRAIVPAIIAICVGVYGWTVYQQYEYRRTGSKTARKALFDYNKHMVLSQRNIDEGRWYTRITSAFAHGNLFHIGFNMFALYSFGPSLAFIFGTPKFAALYLGSAVAGSYAQTEWEKANPVKGVDRMSVGASGAICGLLSTAACAFPHNKIALVIPVPLPIRVGASVFAVGSVVALQQGWAPFIGHADHLGGLAFGVLFWLFALRGRGPRPF